MRFERLRLSGFKSFVEPVELRIEEGLTGIVGPNGCGKSNLLEALRWVMGESSARSLRVTPGGEGMDEVIFAGTARRPARDLAEVALLIANDRGRAPPPWSGEAELEVARRIARGRGSHYSVNGREVRARDVQTLFADAATGAHSPALVSQGKVASIIAARPDERRLLLEEAAGISGLHVRRREAEQRLRAADLNLGRLADVMEAAEAAAAGLRRQARAAERYRALSQAIRAAEGALLAARWQAAEAAHLAAGAARAAAEAELAEAVSAATRLATAQADAAAGLPGLRESAARATAAVQRLLTERATLAAERSATRQRLDALRAALEAAAGEREREEARARDSAETRSRLAAEREAALAQQAEASARQPAEAEAVGRAEDAATRADRGLGAALEAHAAMVAEARAARAALEAARARLDRLDREAARQSAELERLRSQGALAGAEASVRAAEEALEAETARAKEAALEVEAAERAARAASAARATVERTLASARAEVAALEAELKALARIAAAGRASGRVPLEAEPGLEQAVAAALGEDLEAELGPPAEGEAPVRRWAGAAVAGSDPPLPEGAAPLAGRVIAPAELARRLAQVGLVDAPPSPALLASLRPGQRLVSRAGWMWRWDGFVAPPGGRAAAVAEELAQANRARALGAALEAPRARAAAAARELEEQDRAQQAASAAERDARGRRATAEQARDRLAARLQGLRAAAVEARSREGAIVAALERLAAERGTAATEAEAAAAAVAALPDPSASAQAVADARARAERARAELAAARAAAAGTDRTIRESAARAEALAREIAAWAARDSASAATIEALSGRIEALQAERAALVGEPAAQEARAAALEAAIARAEAARDEALQKVEAAELALADLDRQARAAEARVGDIREARALAAAAAGQAADAVAALEAEALGRFGMHPRGLGEAAAGPRTAEALEAEVARLTAERDRLGMVNLRADIELSEIEATLARQAAEKAELETACARLRGTIGALNREGRARLSAAFEAVDGHFRALFAALFEGGQAELLMVDSEDPLEAGLEIRAQPPGKRLQSLSLLSGGEQALTAIALIFALFLTNPAPVCVLDEVDAPLDDANVERFCALLRDMTHRCNTRFLIVTHNAMTMSRMDRLYGVTMAEPGVSQLVSVDLAAAGTLLAA